MNKSATSFNMIYMIPRLMFLVIVVLTIVFMLNGFRDVSYQDAIYAEQQMFTEWILYSSNGVSYFDTSLNSVLPGVINKEDIDSGLIEYRLNQTMPYGGKNKHIAIRISFIDKNKNKLGDSIYYNKGQGKSYGFLFWEPLSQMRGEGAASYFIRVLPCLIREINNNQVVEYTRGNMILEVVIPNYENF